MKWTEVRELLSQTSTTNWHRRAESVSYESQHNSVWHSADLPPFVNIATQSDLISKARLSQTVYIPGASKKALLTPTVRFQLKCQLIITCNLGSNFLVCFKTYQKITKHTFVVVLNFFSFVGPVPCSPPFTTPLSA